MNDFLTAPHRRLSEESIEMPRLLTEAELSLQRVLQQDQPHADPATETRPQYHTGRLPNSKLGDNKPRLLLMGQKR